MQLEAGGIRRALAFPMASADPSARSDRPASAMRVIATRGMQSPGLTRLRRSLRHGCDSHVDRVAVNAGDRGVVCFA